MLSVRVPSYVSNIRSPVKTAGFASDRSVSKRPIENLSDEVFMIYVDEVYTAGVLEGRSTFAYTVLLTACIWVW